MVELLIVIIVIGILVSSILVAASSLVGKSKERNTQSVLQVVADAVEEFKREQTARPTLTQKAAYKKRYGLYPPDELEVFAKNETTPGVPFRLATPTGAAIVPAPPYEPMKFYSDSDCSTAQCQATEHRDLAALIVAIETHGDASAALLAKIPDRNRSAGVLTSDNEKRPAQFLDRPVGINNPTPDGKWSPDDLQIRYILDDWGMPISYLAQRDFSEDNPPPVSSNHRGWNEGSTELIRLNGAQPVIFSYGANGKEQLTADMMGTTGAASLMGDFEPETPGPAELPHVIDNPANADNVYANTALKEKLAKGIKE